MRKTCLMAALAAGVFAAPTQAAMCTNDPVPAASLLLPWFEVSASTCAPPPTAGKTTRFSVTNTSPQPRLAHVTLWTNAAVPAFDFDIYLNGYAQETIDLGALFCNGTMPTSGRAIDIAGREAAPEVDFPGCNTSANPANGAPVYATLPPATRTQLQATFSGQATTPGGQCSAVPVETEPSLINGYITIDVVDRCNADVAGDAGFAAALREDNVLAGRVTVEDPANNVSFGYAAVALEGTAGTELTGSRSFYDFDPAGADLREPLATTFGVDFSRAGTDRTSLVIWRGLGRVGEPFACNAKPPWYPIDFANISGMSTRGAFTADDDGVAAILQRSPPLAPLATQRMEPTTAFALGYAQLNLQHNRALLPGGGQGWVMRIDISEGRYATEEVAASFDSGCAGSPFDTVYPGQRAPL